MNRRDIGVVVAGLVIGSVVGLVLFTPANVVQQVGSGFDAHITSPVREYLEGPLKAHYTFDEGERFQEQYNGSLPAGISLDDGIAGQGLRFDTPEELITLQTEDNEQNGSMSVMLWVKAGADAPANMTPHDYPVVFHQSWYDSPHNFVLQGGLVGAGGAFIAGSQPDTGIASPALDEGWHHLAASFDGTTMTLYVDGRFVEDRTASPQNVFSGITGFWTFGSKDLQATIDEVRVYNTVVDGSTVRSVYAQHTDQAGRSG